jgi:8-oxo-dGTP pyrophosphatase MutT (NUDIX family)
MSTIFMKNPWQTLRSQVVYDNPWIRVTHNDVLNPNGKPGIYGVVHYKHIAIAIVPLDEDDNTWLVGQYRYTLGQYSWEVPEGGGKFDVPPLLSAQRELLEETGISARTWIEAGELHLSNSVTDERGLVFVAKDLSFGEAEPEDTEKLLLRKLPFDEAIDMIFRGEITDALAVAALLKVNLMKERGVL